MISQPIKGIAWQGLYLHTTNEAHWIEKTQNAWKTEIEKSEQFDKNIKALGEEKDKQNKLIRSQKDEIV